MGVSLRLRGLTALLLASAWTAASPPVHALPAAADVARRYADAVVMVERPCPPGGPSALSCEPGSQGFFVSSTGLIATFLPGLREGALVSVRGDSDAEGAIVVVVDPDGLAILRLQTAPTSPVTALAVSPTGKKGRWLIGLSREARGVQAVVGGEEPQGLLVPVPRGAPILNEDHEVVAVCRRGRGGGLIDAVPVARLQALARRAAATTTATTATTTPAVMTPKERG